MDIIIESQYFPPISYFSAIRRSKRVIIDDRELFNKQSYRNRCSILGANGVIDLIAPVSHTSPRKMSKIELCYNDRWSSVHARSIESAYGRSPFFEYFAGGILSILNFNHNRLIDLNTAILSEMCKVLEIEAEIVFLSQVIDFNLETCIDLRNQIHPKKKSLNPSNQTYHQVFGDKFVSDLSILDPLFCLGKETISIIER